MIDLIGSCINTTRIVRTYFRYDENYWYYYPHAINERFLLGQEENDFELDGYHIRKISDLEKAEIKDDLCEKINIWNGVIDEIKNPNVDISSWASIFCSSALLGKLIIIEDELNGDYVLGKIKKVCSRYVVIESVDADGDIEDEPVRIPYSHLTHVAWDTRYSENWDRYLKCHAMRME